MNLQQLTQAHRRDLERHLTSCNDGTQGSQAPCPSSSDSNTNNTNNSGNGLQGDPSKGKAREQSIDRPNDDGTDSEPGEDPPEPEPEPEPGASITRKPIVHTTNISLGILLDGEDCNRHLRVVTRSQVCLDPCLAGCETNECISFTPRQI